MNLVQVDFAPISSGFIVSFRGVQECNLETAQASAVSFPYVKYCKTSVLSAAFFIGRIAQSSETLLSLPQYKHRATFLDSIQREIAAVAKRTFAGWVTGSLHHNVTNNFLISGESQ